MKFKGVFVALTMSLLFSACKEKLEVVPTEGVAPTNTYLTNVVSASAFADAKTINARLGKGINIGDKFEGVWGPGKFDVSNYALIAGKGFKHVRIPINWEVNNRSLPTAPYTIKPEFMAEVKKQVDAALKNNLMVVIDMHHHTEAFSNPAGYKNRFINEWKQISQYFRSYPDNLLFELLNEPQGKLDPATWNTYFADGLAEVRKTNPNRTVLMGVANYGTLDGVKYVKVPADPHLILTVHYYNPFSFTHQGANWIEGSNEWLGTTWKDTEYERGVASVEINRLADFSKAHNIPVHMGEFGTYRMIDMASRVRWTRYMARLFESKGFSWAYWEFDSNFGIFDPQTKQFKTDLTYALVKGVLPAPTSVTVKDIYTANFSQPANGGWMLLNNDWSAASNLVNSNGKLNIYIKKPGQQNWHVQLRKLNIPIADRKKYLIRFTASSNVSKQIDVALQQNGGTWKAYASSSIVLNPGQANYYAVLTTSGSDSHSTITFSLGGEPAANIAISNLKLQEFY